MKTSLLRRRKMARDVLVLDWNLASLEPHLGRARTFTSSTFLQKSWMRSARPRSCPTRTLLTKVPEEFKYDVPVLEFSIIDASAVTSDDATLADVISRAWMRFRL